MGRWTQYDEDEHRLPDGMQRVGYDADTGRSYFRDAAGALWESAEGAHFGELTKAATAPIALQLDGDDEDVAADADVEAAGPRARGDGYQPLGLAPPRHAISSAYRTLMPFLLIVATCLLLAWRLFLSPAPPPPAAPPACAPDAAPYLVRAGDTCWDIAQAHGVPLEALRAANAGVDCDRLKIGRRMCVPPKGKPRKVKPAANAKPKPRRA